jgi:hypothetical protein
MIGMFHPRMGFSQYSESEQRGGLYSVLSAVNPSLLHKLRCGKPCRGPPANHPPAQSWAPIRLAHVHDTGGRQAAVPCQPTFWRYTSASVEYTMLFQLLKRRPVLASFE